MDEIGVLKDLPEVSGVNCNKPVPGGGPEPTYWESTSPSFRLLPGMLPTSQWCHSLNFGSARDGASGSREVESCAVKTYREES